MSKVEKPKDRWRRLDKAKVQELYMTSPCLEWTKFAESQGWNPYRSRTDFPVSTWQEEKRRFLAQHTAEEIKNAVFKIRGEYQLEVIETLCTFPKLADEVFDLLNSRIKTIKNMPLTQQAAIPTRELMNLAKAVDTVTAAKHRALMLDRARWIPDVAEAEATSLQAPSKELNEKHEWRLQVIGAEDLTSADMAKLLASYYDHPNKSPNSNTESIDLTQDQGPS